MTQPKDIAAYSVEECTLRDIRAKTVTDLEIAGHNAQDLAGHTDRKMTERYVKEKVAKKVRSLDGRNKKPAEAG